MPFNFGEVCKLLSDLETLKQKSPPLLPDALRNRTRSKVEYWFKCNRALIHAPDTDSVAFLSTLFPEKRTDRVYGMQEDRLCKFIGRCLRVKSTNRKILEDWRTPGQGDLGDRVEAIQRAYDGELIGVPVTVEEVDNALHLLASGNRFSGPSVRLLRTSSSSVHDIWSDVFGRLNSNNAKWLTRLMLKDFSPVILDEYMVRNEYHFLLPSLMKFQDSFYAAVGLLRGPFVEIPSKTGCSLSERAFKRQAAKLLSPQIGVKVGRPQFLKARSMDNCVKLANLQKWSVERKYDGEYCEIHIDLHQGPGKVIKIFSKSCKDSTEDRKELHGTIRACLRIGRPDCAFKRKCIVIGEMVVFSEAEHRILEFYHIRKHVSRSGIMLGRDEDSQIRPGEHLMIVLYDVLLIDDDLTLRQPYIERRKSLSNIMTKRIGYAITSERTMIDFSHLKDAKEALCYQFAAALSFKTEGLLLKPLDMPYFSLVGDEGGNLSSCIIKLKKDYLPELGGKRDVADFAVVGASYDPKLAHKFNAGHLDFTTFHLGCLTNREAALRWGQTPVFEIVGMINLDKCIPTAELKTLNDYGRFCAIKMVPDGNRLRDAEEIGFDLNLDQSPYSKMSVIWPEPCVVEVLGSNFDRPPNKAYFMLRHPRILKVHLDRTWKDATSMGQLKALADEARNVPEIGYSQEMSQNVKGIMDKFQRKFEQDRLQYSTPWSKATTSPATTVKTMQSSTKNSSFFCPPCGSLRTSPILVRIDTVELCPQEPQLDDAATIFHSSAAKTAKDPLPTLRSSAIEPIASSENGKVQRFTRKRPSDGILDPRPKKIVARDKDVQPQAKVTRTLVDITDSKTTRVVNQGPTAAMPAVATTLEKSAKAKTVQNSASTTCRWPDCPFANAVVYLSPCVRNQPWVAENLLSCHSAERATDLEHWLRDNVERPYLSSTIAESAAWPSMKKIVLVEPYREEPTRALVEEIRKLGLRDEVLFFDWRILEEWKKFEGHEKEGLCAQDFMAVAKRFLYGRTAWSPENEGVSFLGKDIAMLPRSWLRHRICHD